VFNLGDKEDGVETRLFVSKESIISISDLRFYFFNESQEALVTILGIQNGDVRKFSQLLVVPHSETQIAYIQLNVVT
jgi:hypothetical protein